MKYNWSLIQKEFEDRLEKAVPLDLKGFVGIIDAKGYCPICKEKKVLYLNRKSKQSFCSDCRPTTGYEFTAIEFDNMWQLVHDLLYYANEVILELKYPNIDFSKVTPTNMSLYLLSRGWNKKPFGNKDVWKFTNIMAEEKPVEFVVLVPARTDLIDYKRVTELVIETISTFEKRSQYEVFLALSR